VDGSTATTHHEHCMCIWPNVMLDTVMAAHDERNKRKECIKQYTKFEMMQHSAKIQKDNE
jgi:hypothetical protein